MLTIVHVEAAMAIVVIALLYNGGLPMCCKGVCTGRPTTHAVWHAYQGMFTCVVLLLRHHNTIITALSACAWQCCGCDLNHQHEPGPDHHLSNTQ